MEAAEGESEDRVTLMTLHAAKGLEFETVFLPGWEEGLFPNQRALDENGQAQDWRKSDASPMSASRARVAVRKSTSHPTAESMDCGTQPFPRALSTSFPRRMSTSRRPPRPTLMAGTARRASIGWNPFQAPAMERPVGKGRSRIRTSRQGPREPTKARTTAIVGAVRAKEHAGRTMASQRGPRLGATIGLAAARLPRSGGRVIEGELVAKSTGAASRFGEGDRVFHQKFGPGAVVLVDGNKLTVDFDKAGRKMVLESFVDQA